MNINQNREIGRYYETLQDKDTNVFILADKFISESSTKGSVELLANGVGNRFLNTFLYEIDEDSGTNIRQLSAFSHEVNTTLMHEGSILNAPVSVTLIMLTWETSSMFIKDILDYAEQANPFTESIIFIDFAGIINKQLTYKRDKKLYEELAERGLLQNYVSILGAGASITEYTNNLILSRKQEQKRIRTQASSFIPRYHQRRA